MVLYFKDNSESGENMKEIKKYLNNRIGEYSFYFEDLKSGFVYGYNENVVMTAAGCIKLPIALVLLKKVEEGQFEIDDKFIIKKEEMVAGNGIIHEFSEREYSIEELLIAMLIQSDSTAANKIIDLLGMNVINKYIKLMGLKETELRRKTAVKNSSVQNLTTAYDLSICWKTLYNNMFLNSANSERIIEILKRQQNKNIIGFYIPDNKKKNIASKSGVSLCVENDTVLIKNERGNYVFSIMSKNLPNNIYGTISLATCGNIMWNMVNNQFSHNNIVV
jgi:Beta-lactamase class A